METECCSVTESFSTQLKTIRSDLHNQCTSGCTGMATSSATLVEYTTTCWARNAVKSAQIAKMRSNMTAHCWSVHLDISTPPSPVPALPVRLVTPSPCKFTDLNGNVLNTVSTLGMPTTSSPLLPVIRIPHTRTLYSVSG